MLEVIDKGSATEAHPVPLLFVHGVAHAAWCWDDHFLDYFANNGYRALALSLRGHGRSPTSKPLLNCSIAGYVDDLHSVAKNLPVSPVVVGHSVGGYVVQKYLEKAHAPAAVLIASIPVHGARGFAMRGARRHPWLLAKSIVTRDSLQMLNTPALARQAFFCAQTPEPIVVQSVSRLGDASDYRALLDMCFLSLPKPTLVTTPMLVLGAECDGSITQNEVRATAHAYQAEVEFFPNMGHDMMLEPRWEEVAERIDGWLKAQGL